MNNTIRLKRLNHLVTVLKEVPVKKLKMLYWMRENHFDKPVACVLPKNFIKIECSTVCCALGWAALDKQFHKAGLQVISNVQDDSPFGEILYKDFESLTAGREFFGLEEDESRNLFMDGQYKAVNVKPHHVIAKAKRLIKKYEKEKHA